MIDFPNSPTLNQTFVYPTTGVTWRWDGSKWVPTNLAPGWQVGAGLTLDTATEPDTLKLIVPVPIATGGTGATTAVAGLTALGGAPLDSPIFTGNPRSVSTVLTDTSSSIATTYFVKSQGYVSGGPFLPIAGGTVTGQTKVQFADNANFQFLVAGTTKGLRIYTDIGAIALEGVDQTGVISYQPLRMGGSTVALLISGTQRLIVKADGNIDITGTLAAPNMLVTGEYRLADRSNAANQWHVYVNSNQFNIYDIPTADIKLAVTTGGDLWVKRNTTINGLLYVNNGGVLGPPIAGGRALGTRIVLWENAGGPEYAIGMNNATMWYGVSDGGWHKWYTSTTLNMQLSNTGELTVMNDIVLGRTQADSYILRPNVAGQRNLRFACAGGATLDLVEFQTGRVKIPTNTWISDNTVSERHIVSSDSSGKIYLGYNATSVGVGDGTNCNFNVAGNLYAPGILPRSGNNTGSVGIGSFAWTQVVSYAFTNASGRDEKIDIETAPSGSLDQVKALRSVNFHWRETPTEESGRLQRGFIADEVASVFGEDWGGYYRADSGHETISYPHLVSVLWGAVQELSELHEKALFEIDMLKAVVRSAR